MIDRFSNPTTPRAGWMPRTGCRTWIAMCAAALTLTLSACNGSDDNNNSQTPAAPGSPSTTAPSTPAPVMRCAP